MIANILVLVSALCIDTFVAGAAYGSSGIGLSFRQITVINLICSLCLGISLSFGSLLDSRIPEHFTKEICFFSLLFLGCLKLADSSIRQYLRCHEAINKKILLGFSQLRFVIRIYSDPVEADADKNHSLSWKELFFFSIAMSIDSLIAGTMAAFLKIPILLTMGAAFLIGMLFLYLGLFLGQKIHSRCPKELSWISGLLFIIMAIAKR